ncbi:MAG: alpha/beta hydrolase [Chloroflexi bacterium]|jgi:pimeloyl-ACP methyl ester carboxylesterase|nr:MAG: alpha/beta hydrolase [Chloroflexota bacterium]
MSDKPHKRFQWIGTEKEILRKLAEGSELVETSAGVVEYATSGEGPKVLGVHGGIGGYDQGLVLCRPFVENGFSAICPSRPGYLRTPASVGRTFAQQADSFAALLDVLEVNKVGVVGGSAGGPPAYEFAMRHPDRTAALIAIDAISCYYPMPEKAGKVTQALFMSNPGIWFSELLAVNFPKPIIKQILKTEGYLTTKQLKDRVSHILEDTGKLEFAVDFFRTMNPYKPRKEGTDIDIEQGAKIDKLPLERVKAPTLVIHGEKDADVKFSDGEYAAATIPNAEHFWIEEGTHLGFWLSDQAEEVQGLAVDFLNKHLLDTQDKEG